MPVKKNINSKTKLWWECARGHRWKATPFSVKNRKSWCPVCAHNLPLGIEKMNRLAVEKKGKCLSKKYVNAKTKLLWQCKRSHRFWLTPDAVRTGRWCPECKSGKQ